MANPNDIATDIGGLEPNPNELNVEGAPLSVAKNVIINRDGMVETRRGFRDFSSNLPAATVPDQIFESGGVLYANIDNGFWYYDTASSTWLRKRGDASASLSAPFNFAYSAGVVYITSSKHVIWSLNLTTGVRTLLAGRYGVSGTADGTGDAARFFSPFGLTYDSGNLYVCDQSNNTIRKVVVATGAVTTFAGSGAAAHTEGTGIAAAFAQPRDICSDGTNLYVADGGTHSIRKIVISSAAVTTPYGAAAPAITPAHTDGTNNAARFATPQGIAYNGGTLYVSDGSNNCIRKIVISSGAVTTPYGIADPLTTAAHTDGIGNAARFSSPIGIISDGTALYVADNANNCIRKIVLSTGAVTTPYGIADPLTTSGDVDGIGNAARFSSPRGIFSDGTNLYVASSGIRKIYLATGYVAAIDGSAGAPSAVPGNPHANGYVIGPT